MIETRTKDERNRRGIRQKVRRKVEKERKE